MTPDERDARLTAYALGDPGLTAADRQEIEAAVRADPAARQAVEETRRLAQLLTAGLAAEQAALPAGPPITLPTPTAGKPARRAGRWKMYATAAAVLVAVSGGLVVYGPHRFLSTSARVVRESASVETDPAPAGPEWAVNRRDRLSDLTNPDGGLDAAQSGYGMPAQSLTPSRPASPAAADGRSLPLPPGDPATGTTPGSPASGKGFPPGYPTPAGVPGYPQTGLVPPGYPTPGSSSTVRPGNPVAEGAPADSPPPPAVFEPVSPPNLPAPDPANADPASHERYPALIENRFVAVEGQAALSTFGVDVDTASYAIVRKYLTDGRLPPPDAVRLEELVNYFPYRDPPPAGDDPFAVTVELAECPWQPRHRLARIGLKARPVANDKRPPSNLVFLVDVSGSMNEPAKLPLVKASLRLLVGQLGENDRVAMVVYAGSAGLVLDSTSAAKKDRILAAIDRLEAGGSTNGSGGIQQAYAVAAANFLPAGTNRVILCTDGDWNVGTTGTADLVKLIEEKRQTGVFLSVFGFGMGNLRDEMMVQLAGKGNGNYGYIDSLKEAHKALVEQMGGTLVTVAKDVKIQVEFNPASVSAYRLLGYEKRALAAKDFHDDRKDAGEMGAGHVVTALYELVPAGVAAPAAAPGLRYQPVPAPAPKPAPKAGVAGESFVVRMRHKKPDGDTSTLRELPVTDPGKGYAEASEDFRFAASVAAFAMLLRQSPHKGDASFALAEELAAAATSHDPGGYRAEFLDLIRKAKGLSGRP